MSAAPSSPSVAAASTSGACHFSTTATARVESSPIGQAPASPSSPAAAAASAPRPAIPRYLEDVYWWAYVHPDAVGFFEREWLVNAILWGNYSRLRDAALAELAAPPLATPTPPAAAAAADSGGGVTGRLLQVACVYGDLTPRLVRRMAASARLDVVDVVPVQLANLAKKLPAGAVGGRVALVQSDSSSLPAADGTYDQVLLFFLLHEQPEAVRRGTLAEAMRVVKPGGRVVIVEYHEPESWHPLKPLMKQVFKRLEPYALDFWRDDVTTFLPAGYVVPPAIAANGTGGVAVVLDGSTGTGSGGVPPTEVAAVTAAAGGTGNKLHSVSKETYFGGLYQKVVLTKKASS